jgi:hypothetical protein
VLAPGRSLEPDNAIAVAAAGDEIRFSVLVHVAWMNVGRADLFLSDDMFLPGFRGVFRRFPPSEIISNRRRVSLGAGRDVRSSIAVDIAEAEIVREAGRISSVRGAAEP